MTRYEADMNGAASSSFLSQVVQRWLAQALVPICIRLASGLLLPPAPAYLLCLCSPCSITSQASLHAGHKAGYYWTAFADDVKRIK